MPKVTRRSEYENFESLMRRFKKAVEKSGILNDLRNHEEFVKPSMKDKRRREAAVKREWRRNNEVNMDRFKK